MSSKDVVAQEVAEAEFDRLLAAYDMDESEFDEEDIESLRDPKKKILRAIRRGHLTIDADCTVAYTPYKSENQTPITFKRPRGRVLSAMGGTDARGKTRSKGDDISHALAKMSGQPYARFELMDFVDYGVCLALFQVFSAAL